MAGQQGKIVEKSPQGGRTLGREFQFEVDEAEFLPTDPDEDIEYAVPFSRLFPSQCSVYLGFPLEGVRLIGERFAALLFAMLVMSDSKSSDTSSNYKTYMGRRKKAFVGASGSNPARNPYRAPTIINGIISYNSPL